MNRATLADLQRRCYPSITLLVNTTPGPALTPDAIDVITRLAAQIDDRLAGDVTDALHRHLMTQLRQLVDEQVALPARKALALFVSPEHAAAVRLARTVDERVTIDDTFTTRDLVALPRTVIPVWLAIVGGSVTRRQLARYLSVSDETLARDLRRMSAAGLLTPEGRGRSAMYRPGPVVSSWGPFDELVEIASVSD